MRRIGRGLVLLTTVLALSATAFADATTLPRPAAGPDPAHTLWEVGVPSLDAVLAVEDLDSELGPTTMWAFDLGNRRWARFGLAPEASGGLGSLATMAGQDAVYSVAAAPDRISVLDLVTREWRTLPDPGRHPVDISDVAVDTRRERILAWSDWYNELWTYTPRVNRWTKVRRTGPWPSAAWGDGQSGYTLLTYDSAADRAVLAVIPIPGGRAGSTWLFDPADGRWTRARAVPPQLNYGYGEWATNAVYDPIHARTVLFTYGVVATYDSAHDRWSVPSRDAWPGITRGADGVDVGPLIRMDHRLVMDPARGRVLLFGGSALVRNDGADPPWDYAWQPVSDVWAYDVGRNMWTRVYQGDAG